MKKEYKYLVKTIKLPNGKRKYVRAKTREELEEKVAAVRRELSYGVQVDDRTTVVQYFEYWYHTIKAPTVSENTANRTYALMRNHIYPYIGAMKMRDVKPAHIRMVMQRCGDLGHGAQSHVLGLLRDVFSLAADEDMLMLKSPVPSTLKAGGARSKETEPLTPEQEDEILRKSMNTTLEYMVRLFLGTGLRRGELTGLMWNDIEWDKRILRIRRHVVTDTRGTPHLEDGAKTEAGVRDVPLTDDLIAMLREMQSKSNSVYLFTTKRGTIYSASALTNVWKTLNKHLSFNCHPHQLRHTYVTKLFEAGMDIKEIQYLVGHKNSSMTLRIYTHYRESSRKESTLQRAREALAQ